MKECFRYTEKSLRLEISVFEMTDLTSLLVYVVRYENTRCVIFFISLFLSFSYVCCISSQPGLKYLFDCTLTLGTEIKLTYL